MLLCLDLSCPLCVTLPHGKVQHIQTKWESSAIAEQFTQKTVFMNSNMCHHIHPFMPFFLP